MLVVSLQGPVPVNSCYTLTVPPSRGCTTAQPRAGDPAQRPWPQAVTQELTRRVAGAGGFVSLSKLQCSVDPVSLLPLSQRS